MIRGSTTVIISSSSSIIVIIIILISSIVSSSSSPPFGQKFGCLIHKIVTIVIDAAVVEELETFGFHKFAPLLKLRLRFPGTTGVGDVPVVVPKSSAPRGAAYNPTFEEPLGAEGDQRGVINSSDMRSDKMGGTPSEPSAEIVHMIPERLWCYCRLGRWVFGALWSPQRTGRG